MSALTSEPHTQPPASEGPLGSRPAARDTPLHIALRSDANLLLVHALLQAGADVSAVNASGDQPLHVWASSSTSCDVGWLLLQHGASHTALTQDSKQLTALHVAAAAGNTAAVQALLAWVLRPQLFPDATAAAGTVESGLPYCLTALQSMTKANPALSAEQLGAASAYMQLSDADGCSAARLSGRWQDLAQFMQAVAYPQQQAGLHEQLQRIVSASATDATEYAPGNETDVLSLIGAWPVEAEACKMLEHAEKHWEKRRDSYNWDYDDDSVRTQVVAWAAASTVKGRAALLAQLLPRAVRGYQRPCTAKPHEQLELAHIAAQMGWGPTEQQTPWKLTPELLLQMQTLRACVIYEQALSAAILTPQQGETAAQLTAEQWLPPARCKAVEADVLQAHPAIISQFAQIASAWSDERRVRKVLESAIANPHPMQLQLCLLLHHAAVSIPDEPVPRLYAPGAGWSLMTYACQVGSEPAVTMLLESGEVRYTQPITHDPESANTDPCAHVRAAAQNGHERICDMLIAAGAPVSCGMGESSSQPVHTAAREGHLGVLKRLLDEAEKRGDLACSVNARDASGMTPLMLGAAEGRHDVVKALLQRPGIKVSITPYTAPYCIACMD